MVIVRSFFFSKIVFVCLWLIGFDYKYGATKNTAESSLYEENASFLEAQFSEDEIREVVFCMAKESLLVRMDSVFLSRVLGYS